MFSIDWQTAIALAIVLLAAAVMLRRSLRLMAGRVVSGCSSCPSSKTCSSAAEPQPLVQIQTPKT